MVRENSNSFYIGVWCNGNTPLFGGGIIGSSPITPTNNQIISKYILNLNNKIICFKLIMKLFV